MKLATLPGAGPDGCLVLVSRDLSRATEAADIAPTLQSALDNWATATPRLIERWLALENGEGGKAFEFDAGAALAPLPRAWQWLDGSAFESHGKLMAKAFGIDNPSRDKPLMYQGMSHCFLSSSEDVPFRSEDDGIDFEGEFGIIVDRVPMGTPAEAASQHIKLIIQLNDWSLRKLAPAEMKTGFGWIQAKPACSVAPVAVTQDELGVAWRDGRVDLPLRVAWNGERFGEPNGYAMGFSFPELVAHAAATRDLCAGTIIGSGTVSNSNYLVTGSTCIAERRAIELAEGGEIKTGFMGFGDVIEMEARTAAGEPLFGQISQQVVQQSTGKKPPHSRDQ